MSARLGVTLGLLAAMVLAPVATLADPAPDTLLRERMSAGHWNRYRVVTARSTFELSSLHADSIGVLRQAVPRRPAVFTTPDAPPDSARYVRWAEIEHVDAARSNAGKGAAEGAIVGGILGVSVAFLVGSSVHDESALGAISAVPLGVVFGALTGAGFWGGGRWTRIYP